MARLFSGHTGDTAVQWTSGPTGVPTGPSYARAVSQGSLILSGRGAAFGLSGNWDSFEQKGLADNLYFYSFTSYAFQGSLKVILENKSTSVPLI